MAANDLPPLPLQTVRLAFVELCRSVDIALRTQIGDAARLEVSKQDCLRFFITVEQVHIISLSCRVAMLLISYL